MVSVTKLTQDEVEKMSMVDLANLLFAEEQGPMSFKDAFDKIATLKKWNETTKDDKIAQFYTDLNVDGRFVTNGSNSWGLKRWYRSEQIHEDLSMDDLEDMIEDEEIDEETEVDESFAAATDNDGTEDDLDADDYDSYAEEDAEIEDEDFDETFDEAYEDDYDVD